MALFPFALEHADSLTVVTYTVSGTGLCWINNVGSVTLALISEGDPDYDLLQVAKYQAVQVSVISIWNCLGRVTMGECGGVESGE